MKKELAVSLMITCLLAGLIAGYVIAQFSGPKGDTHDHGPGAPQGFAPPAPDTAELERAIKSLELALASNPNSLEVLIELGNKHYDLASVRNDPVSFQKAITYYEKAVAQNPNNADVITDLGTCYFNLKQYDKAVENFRRAMKANPNHPNSRFNLGVVLLHGKNDKRGAIAAWEEFLRLEPNSPRAAQLREQIQQMKKS